MGLEYIGYTPHNIGKLWVDPFDYADELLEAVEFLAGHGITVWSCLQTFLIILEKGVFTLIKTGFRPYIYTIPSIYAILYGYSLEY